LQEQELEYSESKSEDGSINAIECVLF
jgi:hypothetical protein